MSNDTINYTTKWLRYAWEDLETAEFMLQSHHFPNRIAGFHAQQSAEKAIKAILVYLQIEFPYIHDLKRLVGLVPNNWTVTSTNANLQALSYFSVGMKYPGEMENEPTLSEAETAVKDARKIFDCIYQDFITQGISFPDIPSLPKGGQP